MKRAALGFLFFFWASTAEAQTPFYQGKTMSIIVGVKPGDVYDIYARALAQHMPRYLPGKPNIIVQNMTGAGTRIAANHVYNVAKPDGLTLGSILPSLYFDQLIGTGEAKFDWTKFSWIGTTTRSNHLLYMRADTPYKTIEDVRNASEAPKCGATGSSSTGNYMPKLVEEVTGAKFNIVLGYQSGGDIDLAVERGELACRSFTVTAFHAREPFHTWRKQKFVRVLFQTGKKRDERLPDVPTIYELMDKFKTPEASRSLATVVLAAGDVGRPIIATPGLPPDRLKILRQAFVKTVNDPKFKEEAKAKKLELDPGSGEELEKLAKEVIDQPPEIIERMKKLLGK